MTTILDTKQSPRGVGVPGGTVKRVIRRHPLRRSSSWPPEPAGSRGFLRSCRRTVSDSGSTVPGTARQRADRGSASRRTPAARTNTGNVTFVDKTVKPDTTYVYRVTAVNWGGSSSFSTTRHPGRTRRREFREISGTGGEERPAPPLPLRRHRTSSMASISLWVPSAVPPVDVSCARSGWRRLATPSCAQGSITGAPSDQPNRP